METPAQGVVVAKRPRDLRLASIDIGSNGIRFLAAQARGRGLPVVLDQDRAAVRLGRGVFTKGRMTEQSMAEAIAALKRFKQRMVTFGVHTHRVVATSAVRESRNRKAFLARVRREVGLDVEIVNGAEEARLVHRAVREVLPLEGGPWLILDLGGGSLDLALADADRIMMTASEPVGTVRLLESFEDAKEDAKAFLRLVRDYVDGLSLNEVASIDAAAGLVGAGGNIEEIARVAGSASGARGVAVVTVKAMARLADDLASLSIAERINQYGFRPDRADVILPAAWVYVHVAERLRVDRIHVPNVGLREGVLLDLLDSLQGGDHLAAKDRRVHDAAVALGRHYGFDEPHALQVSNLALSLFDQLEAVHKLGADGRRILHTAALLHDIGQYVSYRKHHKHSQYLISNADLPGLSLEETRLVALVARYHRKAVPTTKHRDYGALSAGDRRRVARLAALLRIADAMDREHCQKVGTVHAEAVDGAVWVRMDGPDELVSERWALSRKKDLFERVFRLTLKTYGEA